VYRQRQPGGDGLAPPDVGRDAADISADALAVARTSSRNTIWPERITLIDRMAWRPALARI
jgi:hypothetical protein